MKKPQDALKLTSKCHKIEKREIDGEKVVVFLRKCEALETLKKFKKVILEDRVAKCPLKK
jgi:hypothetical protein